MIIFAFPLGISCIASIYGAEVLSTDGSAGWEWGKSQQQHTQTLRGGPLTAPQSGMDVGQVAEAQRLRPVT